jgi:hypothetical protein
MRFPKARHDVVRSSDAIQVESSPAETGFFWLRWSSQILDESERAIEKTCAVRVVRMHRCVRGGHAP